MKPRSRIVALVATLASTSIPRVGHSQASSVSPRTRPPVQLVIDPCVPVDHDEVRRIVAVELGAQPVDRTTPETTLASIACEGALLSLRVDDPITAKRVERGLDVQSADTAIRARLVAVAIVELIAASWAELDLPSGRHGPSSSAPPDLREAARDVVHSQRERESSSSPPPVATVAPPMAPRPRRTWPPTLPALDGSVGLLHAAVTQPSTGLGLRASAFFFGSSVWNFLDAGDQVTRAGGSLSIAWSPLRSLELYASGRYTSSYSSFASMGTSAGPWTVGVLDSIRAGATVAVPIGRGIVAVGASAAVIFRAGNEGLDPSATGAMFRSQSTIDLSRTGAHIPLRLHVNLGYTIDNSAEGVRALENRRREADPRFAPTDCAGPPDLNPMSAYNRNPACHIEVSRFERYAWGIQRMDTLAFVSAIETWIPSLPWVRAFAEYTLNAAVGWRGGYICYAASTGANDREACLASPGVNAFEATPSWFTLGVRGSWPAAANLSATLAMDIATSGTHVFVREVAPTTAWTGYVGLSIAP